MNWFLFTFISRYAAGWRLGRLLQDGFTPQVIGQSAAGSPDCELSIDPGLDHLLLPGDGDVPRGKLIEKHRVHLFQLHPLHRGKGADVVQILGVHSLGVWHEWGCQDPWGHITPMWADSSNTNNFKAFCAALEIFRIKAKWAFFYLLLNVFIFEIPSLFSILNFVTFLIIKTINKCSKNNLKAENICFHLRFSWSGHNILKMSSCTPWIAHGYTMIVPS